MSGRGTWFRDTNLPSGEVRLSEVGSGHVGRCVAVKANNNNWRVKTVIQYTSLAT